MASTKPEREYQETYREYMRALRRLNAAMTAFYDAPPPLGEKDPPTPWTREHVAVMRECAEAWTGIVQTRQHYDRLRRDLFGGLTRSTPSAPPARPPGAPAQ